MQEMHSLRWKKSYHEGMAFDLGEVPAIEFMLLRYFGLHLSLSWQLGDPLKCTLAPSAKNS